MQCVTKWHNVALGDGTTHNPATEMIEWHNVVLGGHGKAPDQIIVSVPETERSEWALKCVQWMKWVTERSE